jgi:hypothetical protein
MDEPRSRPNIQPPQLVTDVHEGRAHEQVKHITVTSAIVTDVHKGPAHLFRPSKLSF